MITVDPYKRTYLDDDEERRIAWEDQKKILKKYNSKKYPNLRRTAEYLRKKYIEGEYQLNKEQICKDLKIKMSSLNDYLSELNRFMKFQPMRWIPIYGKSGWIEVAGSNEKNKRKYMKAKMKEHTSRNTRFSQTREKIEMKEDLENMEKYNQKKAEKSLLEPKNQIKVAKRNKDSNSKKKKNSRKK